jgi:hypothetical protein
MPAQTSNGLPYPLPTDPVAAGAADICALAEALNATVGKTRMIAGGFFSTGYGANGISRAPGNYTAPYKLGVNGELPTSLFPYRPTIVGNVVSGGFVTTAMIGTAALNGSRWEHSFGEIVHATAIVYGLQWIAIANTVPY